MIKFGFSVFRRRTHVVLYLGRFKVCGCVLNLLLRLFGDLDDLGLILAPQLALEAIKLSFAALLRHRKLVNLVLPLVVLVFHTQKLVFQLFNLFRLHLYQGFKLFLHFSHLLFLFKGNLRSSQPLSTSISFNTVCSSIVPILHQSFPLLGLVVIGIVIY